MNHLDEVQFELLADGDERLELLANWIGSKLTTCTDQIISSKELLDQLHLLHSGSERNFPFKGTTALGTWLGRHKDLIETRLGVIVAPAHTAVTRQWSFSLTRCQGVIDRKCPTSRANINDDAMTPSSERHSVVVASPEPQVIEIDLDAV